MADEKVEAAVARALDGWESLGVTEHNGVLHLPAAIKRRNARGGIDETPIVLRNVTNAHKFTCRKTARQYASEGGLDLEKDTAMVEEIENFSILAFAIRDAKPPHDQHVPGVHQLLALYDVQSLAEVWGRYNVWIDMLDPRFGELTNDQLWQTVVRVAREGNTSPLVELPGYAQSSFIVAMAREALHSPNRPSWLDSSSTFRQAS